MDRAVLDIEFERQGPVRRALKAAVINPLANYLLPAGMLKAMLRWGKSELAQANWSDPGGWRSMVISYDGRPEKIADKILVGAGTMAMALRNRRRLASAILVNLIDEAPHQPPHVLCLGAGPGQIITDALRRASSQAHATLVDISADAFEYGRKLAERHGLDGRVRFVQGDVRDIGRMLDSRTDIVKMLGICEYLSDEQIVAIVKATGDVMQPGAAIVFNSLSRAHGTDRFFRRIFGLHMIHRSPSQLQALIEQARIGDFVSTPEPLGVYHVIVGRKGPDAT